MGKIRKPGQALFHTYCRPKDTAGSRTFQARMVDVRTGSDIKCSGDTFDGAVACAKRRTLAAEFDSAVARAKQRVLAEKAARRPKSHKRGRRETG